MRNGFDVSTLVLVKDNGQLDYCDYVDMIGIVIKKSKRLHIPGALILINSDIVYFDNEELEKLNERS